MSPPSTQPQTWTTRTLLTWMIDAFTKKQLDSPRLMAELLVAHVIGCERLRLYMEADRPASPIEKDKLRELVGRALKHEPVQYLVGEAWFFGLPMHVDPSVLIPRSCSETIVEEVLSHARTQPGFGGKTGEGVRLADICTGSGCIAIALLKHMSGASATATDLSPAAVATATRNATRHKLQNRLEVLAGDLLQPLVQHAAGPVRDLHYLVANPPYIPDAEWNAPDQVDLNVRLFEPQLALRGGPDGLQFVRPILQLGPEHLRPQGLIIVELASCTAREAARLLREQKLIEPASVRIIKDLEGLDRFVLGARRA